MICYLDTSALVKLLTVEAETPALRSWLRPRSSRLSSALARTELLRAAHRLSSSSVTVAQALIDAVVLVDIDADVLTAAGHLPPVGLRSLDAIHLATARTLPAPVTVVTYDHRMSAAAAALGLVVAAPS